MRLGAEVGFEMVAVDGDRVDQHGDGIALVVAAHGRDEMHTLRRGLESGLPYVGLVASPKRGTGVLAELRGDGVPDELLARIDVPAGHRHRRPHAGRDRALDPGPDHRRAKRRCRPRASRRRSGRRR